MQVSSAVNDHLQKSLNLSKILTQSQIFPIPEDNNTNKLLFPKDNNEICLIDSQMKINCEDA